VTPKAPHITLPKPRFRGRIHQFASFVSIPAAIVLVALAPGLKAHLAAAIYGLTLVNMFSTSAIYHRRTWSPKALRRIQALDHSAIYLLIAGTYTPLAVLALSGWLRPVMLIVVWSGAAIMIFLKQTFPGRFAVLSGAMYIVLGWAAVAGVAQFIHSLSVAALVLVVVGGLLYTGGALVLNRHWPDPDPLVFGYHEVWHVFMTSAASCHYVAIMLTVLAAR
jgi:hemolysin III